ncbi:MAG: hypothetical protein AAGB14_00335 [Verrucomicrobiota bacterium]
MAATLSASVAAGAESATVATNPNQVFSVQTDKPVLVQSQNVQSGRWNTIGRVEGHDESASFIAPGESVRIRNEGSDAAEIEVFV